MSYLGLADRVQETSTTTGTGTLTLSGASAGYRTFLSALGTGSPCSYVIQLGTAWETGVGLIYTGNFLARDTVLASSNSDALVSFAAGTKTVFISRLAAFQDSVLLTAGESLSANTAVILVCGESAESISAVPADASRFSRSVYSFFVGFCVHAATVDKPVLVKTAGPMGGFSGLAEGAPVYLSNIAGEITTVAPANVVCVGVAISTMEILISQPHVSGY